MQPRPRDPRSRASPGATVPDPERGQLAGTGAVEVPTVPGYELGRLLGVGASSTVWASKPRRGGDPVAVKVVPVGLQDADDLDAATREFGLLRRIAVDHVLRVHAVVPVEDPVPAVAIVLDLLDGGNLRDLVEARDHLCDGEAVTVLSPIAGALAELHGVGLVHADVSPGNVLLDGSGRPVLSDLGVARLVGDPNGATFGTDGYLAPEVEGGSPATPAADVYGVGALGWLCLTGSAPPPCAVRPALSDAAPGAAPALVAAVERCLATDPTARPDAAAAAMDIFEAAPAVPVRIRTPDDAVSGVTRRIREAALATPPSRLWDDLVPAPPAAPPRWGARTSRIVAPVARVLRSGWAPHRRRLPRVAGPALVGTVLVGTVLTGTVLVGSACVHPRPADDSPRSPVVETSGHHPVPTVLRDRDAPDRDPSAVVRALSRLRADAWNATDPALLTLVDAPDSPALSGDADLLREALDQGVDYDGVAFTVREVSALRHPRSRSTIRATVDTGAYYVVASDGGRESRTARAGDPVLLDLVWVAGSWHVIRVREG